MSWTTENKDVASANNLRLYLIITFNIIWWIIDIYIENNKGPKMHSRGTLTQILTLFRMGLFGAAHGWGRGQKGPHSLKSVTHILYWWNFAELNLT